jgi:hypothetical protein
MHFYIPSEEKGRFLKWCKDNGWVKISHDTWSRYNEGGDTRWLFGKYLIATS